MIEIAYVIGVVAIIIVAVIFVKIIYSFGEEFKNLDLTFLIDGPL